MGHKRKCLAHSEQPAKLRKISSGSANCTSVLAISHSVLSAYYPQVVSLRELLLSRLPQTSRFRRRRLLAFGEPQNDQHCFLDTTLVGVLQEPRPAVTEARKRDFVAFTETQQRFNNNQNVSKRLEIGDVVDFVVWFLLHRSVAVTGRPQHILCHGFQKNLVQRETDQGRCEAPSIAGIMQQHPNENFDTLKKSPWSELVPLLGDSGENILQSLLLDCGIFVQLSNGTGNFYQLSGVPISDLSPVTGYGLRTAAAPTGKGRRGLSATTSKHSSREIQFVRCRMLYAKPSLNAKGSVRFGMKHIQVLNRFPDAGNSDHTVHVMKYVFPRQFGLHNVFSSEVDKTETNHPFKDYTLREHEIHGLNSVSTPASQRQKTKIPKRLRGGAFGMVKRLQRRHKTCSYSQLLRHYCSANDASQAPFTESAAKQSNQTSEGSKSFIPPLSVQSMARGPEGQHPSMAAATFSSTSIMDYATPTAQVSAFCQAVLRHLLVRDALGVGEEGSVNMKVFLTSVDAFVRKRRFESITLHHVSQSIRLRCIEWLRPPQIPSAAHLSQSERGKRLEILHEFLYYIFDSVLIPLIRSNFYVTESGVYGKRLFYFRHDVWRKISEPSFAHLRLSMFEGLSPQQSRRILSSRALGVGQVRLLPKMYGTRTIVNLRRQTTKSHSRGKRFATSVNQQLSGVFSVLKYERLQQSPKLGSAMFSIGEMHERLRCFKISLEQTAPRTLYFVKVDIQSCFDTIPQHQLVAMVEKLVSEDQYRIAKYCELKVSHERDIAVPGKPTRRFVQRAVPVNGSAAISERCASDLATSKKSTVFADTGRQQVWQSKALLKLLQEHVKNNIVKLGKRHFRQRDGIPQGSVLSSLLCSFFYGEFERTHLSFLDHRSSLLLRLIDDFLLITTQEDTARQFLEVMAEGVPSYGISVNTSKSLTNFEVSIGGTKIPRHHGTTRFPYCGMAIDTKTLEISKDRERKDVQISNTLTIEYGRNPGQTFRRRVQTFLKIQMHAMLLDTSHNTMAQVMSSLFESFTETAIKLHQYAGGLSQTRRPSETFIIKMIKEVIHLAVNLIRSKSRAFRHQRSVVSTAQVCWLGAVAFEQVFTKKQSSYKAVLTWLAALKRSTEVATEVDAKTLSRAVEGGRAFRDYVF